MKPVIVIAGVTGSGKTSLSIELSKYLDIEIINADSVSVYKELDIGSAKATKEEQEIVKHHLIDEMELNEIFTVADFQYNARKLIDEIHNRNKIPVIVGGTGLYINAVLQDYQFKLQQDNPILEDNRSNEILYNIIKDNGLEEGVHINNRKRLIRLVYKIENNLLEDKKTPEYLYNAKVFFINSDRDYIYERINKRVDFMFDNGLEKEVKSLVSKYPDFFELPSTNAIGYKEFKEYLNNDIDLETLKEKIKKNTRNFAKRQITWFKNQTPSITLDIKDKNKIDRILEAIKE